MGRIVILLICSLVPSIWAQCNEERALPSFGRAVYEFSANLMLRAAQEKDNHFVASPISIWTLLSCTSLGASGATLAELKEVLRLNKKKCYNEKYLALANQIVSTNGSDVVVERSANIFVDNRFQVKEYFKDRVMKSGLSSFESMSFADPDLVAQTVNDYVSRATHNTIDGIMAPGDLDPLTVMIIIDSIYFKGEWELPFDHEKTKEGKFYDEQGRSIGSVNLMHTSGEFKIRYIEPLHARVLELPYGKMGENRFSMLFFLPVGKMTVYGVIENLIRVNLASIKFLLSEFGESEVLVEMPRFKITSDLSNLKELLADMGLKAMFDASEASFPHISDESLHVSNFIQKADIEVTEEGTVASAATKAEFSVRTSPENFNLNRPFLFMIVDKKYDIPIFTGAYSKPTLY